MLMLLNLLCLRQSFLCPILMTPGFLEMKLFITVQQLGFQELSLWSAAWLAPGGEEKDGPAWQGWG